MDGILNLDKPPRWTSHDVVAWVRRLLRVGRVGHAGTLDPLATGVLLICLGQATRVAEYLMAGQKTYVAQARLGVTTDTFDVDGAVLAETASPEFERDVLEGALAAFVGDVMQAPPKYSAVKLDGVPAHRRARRGENPQPSPRRVRINAIDLLSWQAPHLTIRVRCESGTYIRSLVHDLGQQLGCGATLAALQRTQSGQFGLETALTLDQLNELHESGQLTAHLYPPGAALHDMPAITVDAIHEQRLMRGQPIPCLSAPAAPLGQALNGAGQLVAIIKYDAEAVLWHPEKVFNNKI